MLLATRRKFVFGALSVCALASPASAELPSSLVFAAYRNGKRIGEHRMTFNRMAGGSLAVRTQAEMAVKVGPVTLYRYRHEAVERWRDGAFDFLETKTLAGGQRDAVTANRTSSGVVIQTGKAKLTAPAAAAPLTHWNPQVARAPLFNPQTGKLLKLTVQEQGGARVALADGRVVEARRVSYRGDAQIDNWYDPAGVWTGLRGRLDDGSTMEYRLASRG